MPGSVPQADNGMGREQDSLTEPVDESLGRDDPATLARALSELGNALPAALSRLPRTTQGDVAYELLKLRVAESAPLRQTARDLGGIETVAEILNCSLSSTEKKVLDLVDAHDPHLAEEIRNQMFTFEEIARLSDQDIQQILEEVNSRDMAVALQGVGQELERRFLANMTDADPLDLSAASKSMVQQEMAVMGPVPAPAVTDARIRIVQQARQLEELGRIIIPRGEGDRIL